jgi:hypothetical protein
MLIVAALQEHFSPATETVVCSVARLAPLDVVESAAGSDAIVFVFPLYVDSIPSHLLRFLDEHGSDLASAAPECHVYAIVNNGFYEGHQDAIALEMMRNFCTRFGLTWGQGMGVGAGGMVGPVRVGAGPLKTLDIELAKLATRVERRESGADIFYRPSFPRFLYQTSAHMVWRAQAKKNGLSAQQLLDVPVVETLSD